MKLVKSPLWWCTLFGMTVGFFGIPIIGWGYTRWEWTWPYGFHIPSIFIFGVIGYLVGLVFQYWIWKRLERIVALWTLSIASAVLASGIVGVYSYQAHNETVIWTAVNLGFIRAMQVSRSNFTNIDKALQLVQAGADIQAGVNAGGPEFFGPHEDNELSSAASAFSEAAYFMTSQKDEKKWHESIRFVNQCGAILEQIGDLSYSDKTPHLDQVLAKINERIPKDFNQGWPAS